MIRNLFRYIFGVGQPERSRPSNRGLMTGGFEQLEDRICPDVTWIGGAGDALWSTAANWLDTANVQRVPVANEKITFDARGTQLSTMNMVFAQPLSELEIVNWGGVLTFGQNISVGTFTINDVNGKIAGSKTVAVVGALVWTNGNIGNGDNGTLWIDQSTVLNRIGDPNGLGAFAYKIDGWHVVNHGTVLWGSPGGTITVTRGASIDNAFGSTFGLGHTLTTAQFTIRRDGDNDPSSFTNEGNVIVGSLFLLQTSVSSCGGTWDLKNSATILGNSDFSSTTITVEQNNLLTFGGGAPSYTFAFGNSTIAGAGDAYLASGTFDVQSTLNVNRLKQIDGTITGAGKVSINNYFLYQKGLWDGFGLMEVNQGATLKIAVQDPGPVAIKRGISNSGQIEVQTNGVMAFQQGADITNNANGNILFKDVQFSNSGGKFINKGTVEFRVNLRDRFMKLPITNQGGKIKNTGTFTNLFSANIEGGSFQMGGAQVTFDQSLTITSGTLSGSGILTALSVVNTGGLIQISDPLLNEPPQTLTINGALEQFGELNLRIGADGLNDKLVVNGAATIGGTLTLTTMSGFVNQPGLSWVLVDSSQPISGTFASVNVPAGIVIDYLTAPTRVIARST